MPAVDKVYDRTATRRRVGKYVKHCHLCPPHGGCNATRRKPRCDRGKNPRRN